MKWVVLLVLLLGVVPFSSWLRSQRANHAVIWAVFGFLVVLHGPLGLVTAPVSWASWPGFVKGAEVSVLDFFALAIFLAQPRSAKPFPFLVTAGIYVAAVAISAIGAPQPQAALFYAWQLTRILFLAFVVFRASSDDDRVAMWILNGMAVAILAALASAAWDRLASGILQSGGYYSHQNMLGVVSHFVVLPFLAILLGGGRGWRPVLLPLAGGLIAILTVSRGTLIILAGGYFVLFMLSSFRGWSARKGQVAGIGLLAIAVLAPVAMSSFEKRIARDEASSSAQFGAEDERNRFKQVAAMMLHDHPMGVGANHYVLVANLDGYSNRAGIVPTFGSRNAHVHNAYWLVAAETGYLGLVALLIFLAHPMITAFRGAFRYRRDPRGDLLLGLGTALLALYVHSLVEWLFVSLEVQYMLGATIGLIAGISQQLASGSVPGSRPRKEGRKLIPELAHLQPKRSDFEDSDDTEAPAPAHALSQSRSLPLRK